MSLSFVPQARPPEVSPPAPASQPIHNSLNFLNPETIKLPSDWEQLYTKITPIYNNKVLAKGDSSDALKTPYLCERIPKSPLSSIDQLWIDDKSKFTKVSVYGYHTTGYILFFKPSLDEVIKFAQDHIRKCKHCYVTTDTCDITGELNNNATAGIFNPNLYMHRAVTTLWLYI